MQLPYPEDQDTDVNRKVREVAKWLQSKPSVAALLFVFDEHRLLHAYHKIKVWTVLQAERRQRQEEGEKKKAAPPQPE